ncbi:thiamine phosphate synthase [Gilvimarinus agarilyticus]|uniref:thiamine phosphate synthase n=1 Tax=Gilvimarinus agarilyticus TaxID=679259 RepID=UPI0006965D39|nr:thiamine phosphate synthase [Gilvimarinus agarilyticus]
MTNPSHITHPLYAITDSAQFREKKLYQVVDALLDGGCQLLQYRDKSTDHARRQREARQLAQLCQQYGAALIINDDVQLARQCGAQGVHLGQSDTQLLDARQKLGEDVIIGITCHASLTLAQTAANNGASYLAFGRFFNSHTKPGAKPATLDILSAARERWPTLPTVAIGGIGLHNAGQVLQAGADYTAICHDAFHSANPREFAHTFHSIVATVPPRVSVSFTPSGATEP